MIIVHYNTCKSLVYTCKCSKRLHNLQASKCITHCDASEQHRLLEAINVKFLLRLLRSESGTLVKSHVVRARLRNIFLADPETKWAYRSVAISILNAFCADSLLVREGLRNYIYMQNYQYSNHLLYTVMLVSDSAK